MTELEKLDKINELGVKVQIMAITPSKFREEIQALITTSLIEELIKLREAIYVYAYTAGSEKTCETILALIDQRIAELKVANSRPLE